MLLKFKELTVNFRVIQWKLEIWEKEVIFAVKYAFS